MLKLYPVFQIIPLAFFLFLIAGLHAQNFRRASKPFETGITGFAANYAGDLAGPDFIPAQTCTGVGAFVRHYTTENLHLRAGLLHCRIFGDDRHYATHVSRRLRFQNRITLLAVAAEYVPVRYDHDPVGSGPSLHFFPYLYAGVGIVYGRPELEFYGMPSDQPALLRYAIPEEGSDDFLRIGTPFGLGLRILLGSRLTMGLEASLHPVFSDHLDGVSQNGRPGNHDWVGMIGISAGCLLGKGWVEKW